MPTNTQIDTRQYTVIDLLDIEHKLGGSAQTFTYSFCNEHALTFESDNTQKYKPVVVSFPDRRNDNGEFGRVTFVIRNRGRHKADITPAGLEQRWDSMFDAFGWHYLMGARFTWTQRVADLSSKDPVDTVVMTGEIVQWSDATPLTVTLHGEQKGDQEGKKVPSRTLSFAVTNAEERKRLPEGAGENPIPFLVSDGEIYLGQWHLGGSPSATRLGTFGFPAPMFSAPKVQNERGKDRYLVGENKGGRTPDLAWNLFEMYYATAGNEMPAQVYQGHEDLQLEVDNTWNGKGVSVRVPKICWMLQGVRPHQFDFDRSTANVKNPEFATDGKLDTYCEIPAGSWAYWDIPDFVPVGRIAANNSDASITNSLQGWYDQHNPGPAGITVKVCHVNPAGHPNLAPANIDFGVRWPVRNDYLFGDSTTTSTFSTDVNGLYVHKSPLRFLTVGQTPGNSDQGWAYTHMHDGRMQAYPYNDGTMNVALWNSTDQSNGQFQLAIHCDTTGGSAFIVGIVVEIGVRRSIEAFAPEGKPRRKDGFFIEPGEYGPYNDYRSIRGRTGRRTEGERQSARTLGRYRYTEHNAPVYFSGPGVNDDAFGTYTGTPGARMTHVLDALRFILGAYDAVSWETGTNFGSLSDAETLLDQWTALYGAGNTWEYDVSIGSSQEDTIDMAEQLLEHLPLAILGRVPGSNKRRLSCWLPDAPFMQAFYDYGTAIDIAEHGNPIIQASDRADIINHVRVRYDIGPNGKYRRTAEASAFVSDDGYGNALPLTPVTGVTVQDLCGWSQDRFSSGFHDSGNRVPRDVTISLPFARKPAVAVAVLLWTLWLHYRPRYFLRWSAGLSISDMLPGNIFRLDSDSMEGAGYGTTFPGKQNGTRWGIEYWLARRVDVEENGALKTVSIDAEWVPMTIGDEAELGGAGIGGGGGDPDIPEDVGSGPKGPIPLEGI